MGYFVNLPYKILSDTYWLQIFQYLNIMVNDIAYYVHYIYSTIQKRLFSISLKTIADIMI